MLTTYGPVQRWLHWFVAGLLALQIGLGLWITQAPPEDEDFLMRLYETHDGNGAVIFLAMLLRLAVRLVQGTPPPLPGTPPWTTALARANHLGFYVLLLVQPLLGWFNNAANGFPWSVYGLFDIPAPIAQDEAMAKLFSAAHLTVAIALLALIALHLLGVAYHVLVRRDGLLRRMA